MIEKFLLSMVQEFGPTGILILGLFWIFNKHLAKISTCIENINHNSTKLLEKLDSNVDRICDKIDNKG